MVTEDGVQVPARASAARVQTSSEDGGGPIDLRRAPAPVIGRAPRTVTPTPGGTTPTENVVTPG